MATTVDAGDEILPSVGTPTTWQYGAVTAALPDGGFVAVWMDETPEPGTIDGGSCIRAQFFDADGVPLGEAVIVNSTIEAWQVSPTVAVDGQSVLITWTDQSGVGTGDTSDAAVRGQFFTLDGSRVGDEILLNGATSGNQNTPSVTALADGGYVVVWQDYSEGVGGAGGDTDAGALKAQLFDADMQAVGSEFLVNTTTDNSQLLGDVVALDNGNFAVLWITSDPIGYGVQCQAQVFASSGDPVGDEIDISTVQNGVVPVFPVLCALPGGGFAAAWNVYMPAQNGDMFSIVTRSFDADGQPLADEAIATTTTAYDQQIPTIAALADGGFVLTWQDNSREYPSAFDIKAQLFDANGNKVGDEFLVNTNVDVDQRGPQVMGLAGGGFVIVWTSNSENDEDASGQAVVAQVYDGDGQPIGEEILVNVTTDGDQFSPCLTALDDGGFVVSWTTVNGNNPSDVAARIFRVESDDAPDHPGDPEIVVDSFGTAGNDVIAGTSTNDRIFAKDGDDQIYAKDGDDTVYAGAGNDHAFGGAGNDAVYGGSGDDVVGGGPGNDILGGGLGDDTIFGGPGDDTVYGGQGNDVVYAGEGADKIFAGAGNDLVFGGAGNDTLWGGAGDDTLYGGGNTDVFGFAAGSGNDDIWGFSPEQSGDRLDLQGQGYEFATDADGNLQLMLSGGGIVTLHGVTPDDFDANWII